MKHLTFIFFLLILFSCSDDNLSEGVKKSNESSNNESNITKPTTGGVEEGASKINELQDLQVKLEAFEGTPDLSDEVADSLRSIWVDANASDTNRILAMNYYIGRGFLFTQPNKAYELAQLQYDFAKLKDHQEYMASSLRSQGIAMAIQGIYNRAIERFTKALQLQEELQNKRGIASCLHNIGRIYKEQGDDASALKNYERSLKIKEELDDKKGMANTLNNLGNIYADQGEPYKGMEYYNRSLKIHEELNDQRGVSSAYNNIGMAYYDLKDYDKALEFITKGLKVRRAINDEREIANSLNNIGNIYKAQGNYNRSLEYSQQALKMAQDVGSIIDVKEAAHSLWESNKKLGRNAKALAMYETYISTRDSIQSKENQEEVIRQEYLYEYQKQAALDSVAYAKEQKLAEATIAQQEAEAQQKDAEIRAKRNQQYALLGGLVLVLVFGGVMFNRYRVTQKQKQIIERQKGEVEVQKDIIEETHKEITDSIHYAQRIQSAILPPEKLIRTYLPNSFVFYKPKDVVAGDFYWLEHREGKVYFAAADCTGHGVPGAMVSVVCNSGLNRSVREYGLTDPGQILDRTREIVIQEFEKSEEEVKDGMDIALCSISERQLHYAGANNPLWVVRGEEIIEVKADKQPIGKFENAKSFTTHTLELQQGDTIYLFSDGYVDQFGGEKGKKFKPRALRKLFLSVKDLPMEEQHQKIAEEFEKWRGEHEQIDDVCVFGVRV